MWVPTEQEVQAVGNPVCTAAPFPAGGGVHGLSPCLVAPVWSKLISALNVTVGPR